MEVSEVIVLATTLIALAVVIYVFWKSEKPVTLAGLQEAYQVGESLATELQKVGLMAVASVEQLKLTGKINTEDEAFREAFDYIQKWPGMEELDPKLIARAVEGSYHLYKKVAAHGEDTHEGT